ncbi:carbamoyl-phosphate synthase domain-containing protein [Phenylobacterium sp.]|uniref:carbamoyl-phosphate synthase domain-containing protein n=1 Tax=Phenylobacterium sp. TaxID=1871053 RepID=UPI0025FA60C8|nr:carbamoyl-phosphate synthase domain-containing protein [Phenylobacterium sp.]
MSRDLLPGVTGVLVLADGTVLQGIGVGAVGEAVGEVCFNTAMTGYQEILTDPSYMAQIVAFTFPHIGNVGTNVEDIEQMSGSAQTAARGAIFRDVPTKPANWRADSDLASPAFWCWPMEPSCRGSAWARWAMRSARCASTPP